MKIIAFAGSSSKNSINKKLAVYASSLFRDADVEVLDLNDYELPLFSVDKEAELGKPELAKKFLEKLASADILVLSLAEHNAGLSVAFKNIYDWASRQKKLVYNNTPLLLMSTSPGKHGGKNALEAAKISLAWYGGNIRATFSLPSFAENFDQVTNTISNKEYDAALKQIIADFDYGQKA